MEANRKNVSISRANATAIKPNPKNPWARKIAKTKPTARYRLKQILRGALLNHSFFTKKRTVARRKNYREALDLVYQRQGPETARQIEAIWGLA